MPSMIWSPTRARTASVAQGETCPPSVWAARGWGAFPAPPPYGPPQHGCQLLPGQGGTVRISRPLPAPGRCRRRAFRTPSSVSLKVPWGPGRCRRRSRSKVHRQVGELLPGDGVGAVGLAVRGDEARLPRICPTLSGPGGDLVLRRFFKETVDPDLHRAGSSPKQPTRRQRGVGTARASLSAEPQGGALPCRPEHSPRRPQ